ncbi:uncharacterized protein [Physcomitrium patens]|uniref:S phase cyclin A-associated protein in the endoplasmic reticulum N-terminal domain-containing protein n=1 Tax=Physcomitrium patens TaxID=3218 RepID=A0A2K1JU47_PHYPA|nr:uncharacterized protein LOC112288788 [Physcomitrium patens]XP_024389118.1 uncharacterized protein LOC112288788 [Physcomitrium patens]XP_024389119.1 uncharacterized protein LOC112288788 [Physcomitrium patens]XP_024389120.1 uncharacterized protein LOC112288788 [Physcomitrium patens]XP_024389121.1 uncharacterized protein LOC112288788 [Physcomitrium patens]PNR45026.1 hypothetical protein PHYPA_014797 [Physcomitrium patens]|eukprot:XP_024389117.1 uncharacterized protein LOC112288788 [Physcomitrella patens]
MGTPEFFIMEEKTTGSDVILEPLVVPEFVILSESSPVQEADLGLQRRFDLAFGEVKYFKPDLVVSKPSAPSLDISVRSESAIPKRCNCTQSHEESCKNCSFPEMLGSEQSQVTASSLNSSGGNGLTASEGDESCIPAISVAENVIDKILPGEDGRNIPTPDTPGCGGSTSSSEMKEVGLAMNDDSTYLSTSLDSSNLATPTGESREIPKSSLTKEKSLTEDLTETLNHNEGGVSKSMIVAVNSKRKFQHLSNSEFCSNSGSPKSREMSGAQLRIFVDGDERDVTNDAAEERRKSLINAAIAADLPKFKWGDLDMEDLENMQAVSKNGANVDSRSLVAYKEFHEDVRLDAGFDSQESASPGVEQELRGLEFSGGIKEQRSVCPVGQQIDFPGFVVPLADLQEEVAVAAPVQTSTQKMNPADLKESVEGAFQDVEVYNSDTPGLGERVSAAEVPELNEQALKDGIRNVEESSDNAMALVPVTDEASCENYIPDSAGGAEAGEGKERFRQRLWCYLFENMNRAIDELYFLCELESDVEQIKEALLVLDEAGLDFKDLKARVEGFDRVNKGPGLPRPASAASTSSSVSSKGDPQQRRPHAIAWEVRRMACSQEQADLLSSSLEAFKRVHGSLQFGSSQGRRRDTSQLLSPESEKLAHSEYVKLKESVAASREIPVPSSKEIPPRAKDSVVTFKNTTPKPNEVPPNRRDASLKSNDDTPNCRDVPSKSKEVVSSIKELPAKVKDGIISKITDTKLRENQNSRFLSKSLNIGPPRADRRQAYTSENLSSARATASPKQKESLRRKGSSISDSELLTNRSIDSASKRSAPSTSIDRFMSPTASSEQRASSREKQLSVEKGAKTALEAWKEKRNWEDILSTPLSRSSRVSRSPGPGRKSTERVRVLHDKLMSPERKKRSPLETKKEVDGKQARATRIRMELENEKVQRLQKTTEKLTRVSEWQAVRSNKLRGGMHARQQRGESRHEAHLAQIARRASDESSKVSEVRFITSLNEENKKLVLQQKLLDSESRRAERLQSLKLKQKEDIAKEEAAQERRRQLEAERLQRIAEVQRRKDEAKARREEERKAASAAREARAVEHVRKKEAWAKAQQEEAELLGQRLSERLRESSLRRKIYLEQIRERAMMDFDKQDKRSRETLSEFSGRTRDQGSPFGRRTSSREKSSPYQILENESERDTPLGRGPTGGKRQAGVGLISLVGDRDNVYLQVIKKRVKRIRQRLTSRKTEFNEPPSGIEGHGLGTATVAGGARSKIGRWMQELGRLQAMRKPGSLTSSGLIISEIIKYLEEREPELHAARQQGLVDYIATALPASHSSKPEASAFTVALLRLLMVVLSLPANRSYFIARNLLPPLIPMLSTALENFSTSDSVNNQGVLSPVTCSQTKEVPAFSSENQSASVLILKEESMSQEEKSEVMQAALEGLLWVVLAIIGHSCVDDHLIQMQEDLAELVVACEVLHKLKNLFALFDRPQMEGAAIPGPVLLGLRLLETLTGPRGKALTAAHEAPVNIVGRSPQPPPEAESGQEDAGAQKLDGVREECVNENSCVLGSFGASDETKVEKPEAKTNDLAAVSSTIPQMDEKNQKNLNRSTKFLLEAIEETGLVGLPSLLTAVLLQANPRATPEQAATALPSNFEEVATSVLRVLNNVARLDLSLVQNMLALPDLRMEFFHLVSFLLSHCTCKWKSTTDQVAALLMETLLLLGYAALLHPGNQAVLRWGKSPTILHKMCDLPFAFFSDPKLTPILIGTLLSVCYGSERNREVVQQELSMDLLLGFLKNLKQPPIPAPAPDMRSEDDETSVKSKPKSASEPESAPTTARGRTRHKSLSDAFFPSPKKPNRLLTKSSLNLSSSMSMVSSDGDSISKEFKSGNSSFRNMSGRVAPITESQTAAKRSKGAASGFPSPSLSIRSMNLSQTQTTPVTNVASQDVSALSSTSPAVLSLRNRFPQNLWSYAEDFFSTSPCVENVLNST